jgi:hypothetical protein
VLFNRIDVFTCQIFRRIVVCDGGGGGVPRLRGDRGLAEGGWGLRVVESLAVQWGLETAGRR